jgi:tungstate transport system ATP-binding protein
MTDAFYTLTAVQQRYGERTVLNIPALTIQQGELVAIVGPSGSGKSTLLRLLALLEAPASGTVNLRLNERDISYGTATIADHRQITMVFQQPLLLSRSVWANVAYGLKLRGERDGRQRIDAALERVALSDLARSHARSLSGGEAQRVALARALVRNRGAFTTDGKPRSGNVRLIETLVHEQQSRWTTVVLITHNIFQARRLATRIGFLFQGELVEVAPTERFFTAPQDARTAAFISGDLVY